MMDGVQLRWLRTLRGSDLNAMWAECEDALFPLPHVGGSAKPLLRHCIDVWMQT